MRTSLCLLLLAIVALPLAAQLERRMLRVPTFPPDVISQDGLTRDIVRLGSSHVRVDFENDRTRVLRLTLGAAEAIPLHDARPGVLAPSEGEKKSGAGQAKACPTTATRVPAMVGRASACQRPLAGVFFLSFSRSRFGLDLRHSDRRRDRERAVVSQ